MPTRKEKLHLGMFMNSKNSLFLLPLLMISCSDLGRNHSSARIALDRPWELVAFIDKNGNELDLYDYEVHTLGFLNESEFNGGAACNKYGGNYVARENGKITVRQFYITEALCRQPSLGEEFADAVLHVNEYEREEGRLKLYYRENGKLIFLERLE
ncbi:MAG: META domain-containing protein [Bacteroidetes bacterium]|jgi:heat shock protein HslJ|nr:META domain-containing protein [Bacteroidota bacterium]